MPRGSSSSDLKKKREKLFTRQDSATGRTKNSNNKSVVEKKKSTGKKPTGVERAKAMSKKNIKKYGGTASAAAANKEAMRLKIKKKYLASKKKK